jgi:hypothetical protein
MLATQPILHLKYLIAYPLSILPFFSTKKLLLSLNKGFQKLLKIGYLFLALSHK